MRGNSSMEIKHIPGVAYLNMQRKLFSFSFFFQCFLALQVEQHVVRGGCSIFICSHFKIKSDLGQLNIIHRIYKSTISYT